MRPFWMHQIVEYVIGASFISAAIPSSTPVIPIVLGVIVLINSAIAIGPAGAFRVVHRQVHRVIDLAIMGLILLAAIQPMYELDNTTRALIIALGLVMAFVWWNSDFATREQRKQRRRSGPSGSASTKSSSSSASAGTQSGTAAGTATASKDSAPRPDAEEAGRSAGRSAAEAYLAAKRLKKAMVDDRKQDPT